MSAKRFEVEKNYFDKRTRVAEEILKPKQDRVMDKTQDSAVPEEYPDVPTPGIEPPHKEKAISGLLIWVERI